MMVYVEITGYIKNHQKFKFLFWSQESEKMIFTIFPENFYEKMGRKYGITSETTITEISSDPAVTGISSDPAVTGISSDPARYPAGMREMKV